MSELPAGWLAVEIGDLCELVNGRAFKPQEWDTEGLPIIRIQNLNRPGAAFNFFSGELDPRHLVATGQLLFAWSGTPGTSFGAHVWNGPSAALNQHIFKIAFDSKQVDKNFFRHAINQKLEGLIGSAQGGVGLRHVTKGTFERTQIALPPLAEQKRITQKLDALLAQVDTLKARIDAIPALLKRFRQSVLATAIRGDWSETRDTWKRSTIGELGNVVTGSTPSTTDKKNYGGEVCFFKPSDLNAGYKAGNSAEKLSETGASCARRIPAMAVMVTCIGATIGKTGLARSAGTTNQQINSVICDQESAVPEWLYFWFISPAGQAAIIDNAAATTLPILNKSKFSALQLSLPRLSEQREIVRRVEQLFAYADQLEAKVAAAQQRIDALTQSLLAKAFRGELVPQDPSDEPASALLERIRAQRAATPKPKRGRKAATSWP